MKTDIKPNVENIILIGFMASGKSSVGKILAQELGWEFIDTDTEIEKVTGFTVADIFKTYGEAKFRWEESLIVRRLADVSHTVISTGGGMVLNPENLARLQILGILIHLYVPWETAIQRVRKRQERPMLTGSMAEIEQLWRERQNTYHRASITVDTADKEPIAIAAEIAAYLKGD